MPEMTYYLSIGSNVEFRLDRLREALKLLDFYGMKPVCVSDVFETEPVYGSHMYPFLNICVKAVSDLNPLEAFLLAGRTERTLGRQREISAHRRYRNRPVDIDFVLIEEMDFRNEALEVPHRDFRNRSFVLVPLLQVLERSSRHLKTVLEAAERLDADGMSGFKLAYRSCFLW